MPDSRKSRIYYRMTTFVTFLGFPGYPARPARPQKAAKVTKVTILSQKQAYLQAGISPRTRFCPLLGEIGAYLTTFVTFIQEFVTLTAESSLLLRIVTFAA